MTQPEGFEIGDPDEFICQLLKSLYGLKQAGNIWRGTISEFFIEKGLHPTLSDMCIYRIRIITTNTPGTGTGTSTGTGTESTTTPPKSTSTSGTSITSLNASSIAVPMIGLYVDDLFLLGDKNKRAEVIKLKSELCNRFEMTDLGEISSILGIKVQRRRISRSISLDQTAYIKSILDRFRMTESNPVKTPVDTNVKLIKSEEPIDEDLRQLYQQAVGSLMYIMIGTRPDIAYAVSLVSRFASNPNQSHWTAVKRILRYLKGSIHLKLTYSCDQNQGQGQEPHGYSDADWAGDLNDRRSTSGYVFLMSDAAVVWSSMKQQSVALSTTEAEYIGISQATREALWIRTLLKEIGYDSGTKPMTLHCDNQSCIAITKNPVHHSRTKHIDIRYHFIKDNVKNGTIKVKHRGTDVMVADSLTKALPLEKFEYCRRMMGVIG